MQFNPQEVPDILGLCTGAERQTLHSALRPGSDRIESYGAYTEIIQFLHGSR